MEDEINNVTETNSKGVDWEVVSLTASAYAAAPGPQRLESAELHKDEQFKKNEHESSDAILMSKHYVISPHEQEQFTEAVSLNEDKCKIDTKNDPHGSRVFEAGKSLAEHTADPRDREEGLTMAEKEALKVSPYYESLHKEADMSQSDICHEVSNLTDLKHASEEKFDQPIGHGEGCTLDEEKDYESSAKSHEAWWKRGVVSAYNNAKGTNTFWSIFVAVAVAGLVIIGQRWRRGKAQPQQFKWKFNERDEKISTMAGTVNRFKDVIVGGQRRGSWMREGMHPSL